MRAAIRKSGGIEEVLGRFDTSQVEESKEVVLNGSNAFLGLLEKYELFLGRYDEYEKAANKVKWSENCIRDPSTITDILSPAEINSFLQTTIIYEDREEYGALTGIFITLLIQNSYNAGNNDFQLDTRSLTKNLTSLGAYLKGRKEKKLQITITGDVGDWCGYGANNSTFNITGDVGDGCGAEAKNSTFNITGDVGYWCGRHANNSTFKTSNEETLKKLGKSVYTGNRIIYVKKDGTEEVIR